MRGPRPQEIQKGHVEHVLVEGTCFLLPKRKRIKESEEMQGEESLYYGTPSTVKLLANHDPCLQAGNQLLREGSFHQIGTCVAANMRFIGLIGAHAMQIHHGASEQL